MNRIKDYTGFAASFAGLGYIVLWPITADEFGGAPFGASIFCQNGGPDWLSFLCNSAHPLRLPPGLHALGFISALFVTARLAVGAVRRSRRALPSPAPMPQISEAPPQQRRPQPPLRQIKPRTHFGLRGIPR